MSAEVGSDRHQFNTGFCPVAFDGFAPFRQIGDNPIVIQPDNMMRGGRQDFINKAAAQRNGRSAASADRLGKLDSLLVM